MRAEQRDADHREPGKRPHETRLVRVRQERRRHGIHHKAQDIVRNVDQELVPALRIVPRVEERDEPDNQLAAQQAATRREGDPAAHVDPPGGP